MLVRLGNVYEPPERPEGTLSSGRRSSLANWITAHENPLLARVLVNRIWQQHFGTGIVRTLDNLGRSGAYPTHPELLDWLATEFVRDGWSMKKLHRIVLTSETFRQSSQATGESLERDSDGTLWSRYPLRRLDGEAIRDAMLAIAGELDRTSGGPYVPIERLRDGRVVARSDHPGALRRSLYLKRRRTAVVSFLETFDAPSIVVNCLERTKSTVPLQSLALLNSEFAVSRAAALAKQVLAAENPQRIEHAFALVYGRPPLAAERAATEAFIASQRALHARSRNGTDADTAERLVWRDVCQMLFASNAFLYLD